MSFGNRLKKARQDKNLSQSQLGETVGVHYTQIGRYESKGVKPAGDILSKIATVLGVSSDYLIGGTANDMADITITDKELLRLFKKAEQLPADKKTMLVEFVDAFILKQDIQKSLAK
jgi:transcriptional regulator with XRE-family HTH domain